MPRSKENILDNAVAFYNRAVEMHPQLTRKGKKLPFTSVNGHMSSFLDTAGNMGLRLSPLDRDDFMKTYHARIMQQYGRQMHEYVEVPEALLSDSLSLLKWLDKSYAYVAKLKPKPTTHSE